MEHSTRRAWLLRAGNAAAMAALGGPWTADGSENPQSPGKTAPSNSQGAVPTPSPLVTAMQRAAQCCLAWLDSRHHWRPTGGYEIAHDTGRWWDAMLRLQAATGFAIPAEQDTAMHENVRALGDNVAGLLTNDGRTALPGGTAQVNPHNFRESMLAYSALVRQRRDALAMQLGRRLVETTRRMLEPDGQMAYARLAGLMKLPLSTDPSMVQCSPPGEWFDATGTTGRALEGFVCFHEASGDATAGDLAETLARVHLRHVVRPDGRIPPALLDRKNIGHNHSYLGTLRGLLRYGLSTGRREFVGAVAKTYRHGLFGAVVSYSGWTPHDLGRSRFPNEHGDPVGEHASCADVIQLALWLAMQAGHIDLLDDVERLLRARILPSQIVNPTQPRQHGGWGAYGHPFGRGCILDVFAAVLSVLTEVHRAAVIRSADGAVSVNLHFSIQTPLASVEAIRGERGCTRIRLPQVGTMRIRVPGWSPRTSVRVRTAGRPMAVVWDGPYVVVPASEVRAGEPVEVEYDLPERTTVETMPVSRRQFRLQWRGDEVAACDPEAPIYPARKGATKV